MLPFDISMKIARQTMAIAADELKAGGDRAYVSTRIDLAAVNLADAANASERGEPATSGIEGRLGSGSNVVSISKFRSRRR